MNPMFLALLVAVTVLLLAVIVAYVVVRPQRTRERMAALEKGTDAQLYFSGRLLSYIPWQFWTSVAILVLLIVAFFISSQLALEDAQKSFLELVKYVTGAVFGSMFGKGSDAHASNARRS